MKMKPTALLTGIIVAVFMHNTLSLIAGEVKPQAGAMAQTGVSSADTVGQTANSNISVEKMRSSESQTPYPALSDDLVNAGSPALAKVLFEDFTPFQACNAAALNDGKLGTPLNQGSVTFALNGLWTVTFVLDTLKAPRGYDIREIRTIAGWPPNRACQKYELLVSKVSDPDKFISLGLYEVDAKNALATQIKLTGTENPLAINVAIIKFKIMMVESSTKGQTSTTYREIDVIGNASK